VFIEYRNEKRFNPAGLKAVRVIDTPEGDEFSLEGNVIDISYNGIKIKLNTPLVNISDLAEIKISLVLPESGIPVTIRGTIKHVQNNELVGMQYHSQQSDTALDQLIFECIKLAPEPL
jgi:hypothetical protein